MALLVEDEPAAPAAAGCGASLTTSTRVSEAGSGSELVNSTVSGVFSFRLEAL